MDPAAETLAVDTRGCEPRLGPATVHLMTAMAKHFRPVLAALLLLGTSAATSAATIILVRHAERAGEMPANPPITAEGQRRAQYLAKMLAEARVEAIFTTETLRTQQTAAPAAEKLAIRPVVIPQQETDALVARLKALGENQTVLVVGHSGTMAAIVEKLGGGKIAPVADSEYNRMLVVHTGSDGKVSVTTLRFDAGKE